MLQICKFGSGFGGMKEAVKIFVFFGQVLNRGIIKIHRMNGTRCSSTFITMH